VNQYVLRIPSNIKANIPPAIIPADSNPVSVRISQNAQDIDTYRKTYAGRIFDFEIEDDIYHEPEIIKRLSGTRIRIKSTDTVFEIDRNLDSFRQILPIFTVTADDNLVRKINYLAGFGFQTHINMVIPAADGNQLEKALEFYLHNPLLKTPIEPFHSLLKTLAAGAGYSLWDTEYERAGSNIYIGDNGGVSLSERWLARDLTYGNLENSWEELSASDLFKKLKTFKAKLFQEKSDCIFCPHMDICGGFLRAVDTHWPCQAWIQVFDIMRREVKKARNLLKDHFKESR
jgi:radical SAM protein with 4Fe4S-binding SPASM domain